MLFVPFLLVSCTSVRPLQMQGSSLTDSSETICEADEEFVPFALIDTDATPDLAAYGFAGDLVLKKPSQGVTVRFDMCLGANDHVRVARMVYGSVEIDASRALTLVPPGSEVTGLQEALFTDSYGSFRIYVKAAGILPYYLAQGFVADGQAFVIASRVTTYQGTSKLASTSGGWVIGKLAQLDPFPTTTNPCGEFNNLIEFTENMTIGQAVVNIKGCEKVALGEGSSVQTAQSIKIVDASPHLPAELRGERTFTGALAAAIYEGGGGHHGCNRAATLRLPEVLYHHRVSSIEEKRIEVVQYLGREAERFEEPAMNVGPSSARDADEGDPSL